MEASGDGKFQWTVFVLGAVFVVAMQISCKLHPHCIVGIQF